MPKALEPKSITRAQRLRQGSAARRERGKLGLRKQILEAATALFETQGYEAFSLRQVAEHIGYSPTAIYLHFKDKNALLLNVAYEGFKTFGERLQTAFASTNEPNQRLRALGHAYARFAFDFPLHYRLMFMQRIELLEAEPPEGHERVIDSFGLLLEAVRLAMDAGVIQHRDARTVSALVWSGLHGIVSLSFTQPIITRAQAEQLVVLQLELVERGLHPQ